MTDPHCLPPGSAPAGASRGSAMPMPAALLDRSVEQIAEAAADVRHYDREAIRAASDVWDNNLIPLFWAASTANTDTRERRALTALEWMAGLGERRRRRMTEQPASRGTNLSHQVARPLLAEDGQRGGDAVGLQADVSRTAARSGSARCSSSFSRTSCTPDAARVIAVGSTGLR